MVFVTIDPTSGQPFNTGDFLQQHPIDDSSRRLRIAVSECDKVLQRLVSLCLPFPSSSRSWIRWDHRRYPNPAAVEERRA